MPDMNLYADQLNIETPEQVDLHFPVAGVGSRFVAILLDTVLQILAYLLLVLIIHVTSIDTGMGSFMGHHSEAAQKWFTAAIILVHFLLFWGYFALFEGLWKGQTPGKHWMKLRVLKDSGRSITLFEAMARNLLRIIDYLPGVYLVGLISILCNRRNKRLGDFVAGTIVVHERLDEQPLLTHVSRTFTANVYDEAAAPQRFMPRAQEAWASSSTSLPADAVARLTASDLHVIETFFHRALDLTVGKRAELGARVAAQMSAKMNFARPEGMEPERMLELIAHTMRAQGRG